MRRLAARALVAGSAATLVGLLGHGCQGDSGGLPSELDDAGHSSVQDAPSFTSSRDGYVPPEPRPPSGTLEEGWEWWTDYVPGCAIQIPASPAAMPPPLAWEPCAANEFNQGLDCRWLVHPEGGRFYTTFRQKGVWRGPPRLSLKWASVDQAVHASFVVDPDGPTLFAAKTPLHCGISGTYVAKERLAFALYSDTLDKEYGRAIATIGERPRMTETISAEHIRPSLEPSSIGALRLGATVDVLDWATLASRTLVTPDGTQATYQPGNFLDLGVDGRIFVEAGSRMHLRSYAYALDQQPIDLFGPGLREGRGIVEIATDGVDLAWVERYYPDPTNFLAHAEAVYTAPFTLDPATLAATRRPLSFQPDQAAGTLTGALGCGRWARVIHQQYSTPEGNPIDWYGLEIFRLADGHRWFFPSNPTKWSWQDVLGMTCDEMFVVVNHQQEPGVPLFELARIRLDTLPD